MESHKSPHLASGPVGWAAQPKNLLRVSVDDPQPELSDKGHAVTHDNQEEALQWLLERCGCQFVEEGTWPDPRQVIRDAARAEVELESFFYGQTPREFLFRQDHNGVVLSVLGLSRTAVAEPLLNALVRFARLCVERYLGEADLAKVSADDLRGELGMDDVAIDRLYKLFTGTEYFLTASGGGQDSSHWSFEVNDLVRKFRGVETLDQYLEVRHSVVAPKEPLPPAALPAEFLRHDAGQVDNYIPEGDETGGNAEIATSDSLVAFVSWAHVDEEWESSVLEFTNLLRAEGIDAHVDLYDRNKGVDWQLYGTRWIERADFVLIVTNAAYKERWAMEQPLGTGAGVAREAVTLRRLFDDDRNRFMHKVRVVLLPGLDPAAIPPDISHLSWVQVPALTAEGIDDLVRHMTGEDAYPMPELGPRKKRGPRGSSVPWKEPPLAPVPPEPAPPVVERIEVTLGEPDVGTVGGTGNIELRVPLIGKATTDWIRCFSGVSSSKEGSLTLVMSDPNIRNGQVIWRVEERDLESAIRHIRRRVISANMLFAQEQAKQAEREAQQRGEEQRRVARSRGAQAARVGLRVKRQRPVGRSGVGRKR